MLIHVIADEPAKISKIREMLEPRHTVSASLIDDAPKGVTAASLLVDADLRNVETIASIRLALPKVRGVGQRLFIVDRRARAAVVQAYSLGASSVIPTPLDARSLQQKLAMLYPTIANDTEDAGPPTVVSNAAAALASMFDAVLNGRQLDFAEAQIATSEVIDAVASNGLTTWLDNVRRYHEGTFQHCLLVTGVAVDFALSLGFHAGDVKRLGVAATLHDVGKAAIPLEILDKPGALAHGEMAIMQGHARLGYDALRGVGGVPDEVLDAVRHHHEFLDGTGYPDRLTAPDISDLVRVLTIADIFAALIEVRAYRPPMAREKAYSILQEMAGPKLEKALVTAFRDVALTR
ncbi:HD domain-containing phosphohydrolase [Bradyrhizobium sp. LHD-71]|uniref:HD-GYP domain-containing protein n=1 Tax=Bradyrhizobium sp. LHD-71 TaxID=3072141 RepID=UPI00281089F6|nr:HD domain-containing phosphohydrolase [Bradyrhizobium sp. LHD-71]MDQ8732464.1 HD domain-containing protein [Bradyrhizobium sp. LHD-71]